MSEKVEQSVEILEQVSKGAQAALVKHLKAQGVGEDALALLDGLIYMTRAESVLKYRERHWQGVALGVAKALPGVLRRVKSLGGVSLLPDLSAILTAE